MKEYSADTAHPIFQEEITHDDDDDGDDNAYQ